MIEDKNRAVLVDAIENGKIVRVSEDYAKSEGLLVLRRPPIVPTGAQKQGIQKQEEKRGRGLLAFDELRKPLKPGESDITNELIQNFQWHLGKKRRAKGITRKQLADSLGESEYNIKLIENGILPANNFVLVNKLENYFGMALRKNKGESKPLARLVQKQLEVVPEKKDNSAVSGSEIEIKDAEELV